jgi:hypothetical protein
MHHPHHDIRSGSRNLVRAGIMAALFGVAGVARAEDGLRYETALPIPRSMLAEAEPGDASASNAAGNASDGNAVMFEPDLTKAAIRTAASNSHVRARLPVPVDIIRNGFSARSSAMGAQPERSVGFKLGADIFSVTTRVVAPSGQEQGRDARIDWRLARPIANTGTGVIWTVSTQGGSGIAARPEQSANLLVGYRHQLFEHLTLTSQVTMAGNYVFAPDGGPHSTFVPEVKLSANLAKLADLPWETTFDVTLARQVPLVASAFETRGTAMLRLKYGLN